MEMCPCCAESSQDVCQPRASGGGTQHGGHLDCLPEHGLALEPFQITSRIETCDSEDDPKEDVRTEARQVPATCELNTPVVNHGASPQGMTCDALDAAVRVTDGEEPANTVRAWILGLAFVTIVSAVNMLLSMRWPVVNVPTIVVVLLVHPLGSLWARLIPSHRFRTLGVDWSLNPGPFNLKEHAVVTLMANVIAGFAYPADALLVLRAKSMYNLDLGWGFQILFTLSSHMIGIGVAGILRRVLVWPPALVWPGNFATTTLLYALHDHSKSEPSKTNGWQISRYHFFGYVAIASLLWYWIPGVLWKGLSVFSFITWIRPRDATVNQLFGGFAGLSLIPVTLDWTNVISWLNDPLLAPTSAHLNALVGLLALVIVPAIIISYSGALYANFLPISSPVIFDNTQKPYDVTRILGADFTLDLEKYRAYSPLFLTPTYVLSSGASFAAVAASIVHTIIFHRREIGHRFWNPTGRDLDVHTKLMMRYREASDWWYGALLMGAVALGLIAVLVYPSQLPWWAYFASLGITSIFVIPCCLVYSTTNILITLNALSPFLAGFITPGKPVAVVIFKIYSTLTAGKVQVYSQDLKLAHYLKIPPRVTFSCQVVATIWATLVQVAVMNWALGTIDEACAPEQKDHFTCPNARSFFSSSIVYGVVGPSRIWGSGATYAYFNFFWVLGVVLPMLFYIVLRSRFAKRWLYWLNAPVLLGSIAWIPPATPLSYFSWIFWGLVFNHGIRRRFGGWWRNYNYLTAAGLDSGLLISTMIVLLTFTLSSVSMPQWWGNTQVLRTMDANGTAIPSTLAAGEKFGPRTW